MPLAEPPDGLPALLHIYERYKHLGHFLRVDGLVNGPSPLRAWRRWSSGSFPG